MARLLAKIARRLKYWQTLWLGSGGEFLERKV
jgi:hypothetical protein